MEDLYTRKAYRLYNTTHLRWQDKNYRLRKGWVIFLTGTCRDQRAIMEGAGLKGGVLTDEEVQQEIKKKNVVIGNARDPFSESLYQAALKRAKLDPDTLEPMAGSRVASLEEQPEAEVSVDIDTSKLSAAQKTALTKAKKKAAEANKELANKVAELSATGGEATPPVEEEAAAETPA